MFTGMIEATGKILEKGENTLSIERPVSFDDLKLGSSIAVAGTCLSIVGLGDALMRFDVVPETWSKTKLGNLKAGDYVNLERAMKASDRLDGHIVQGHIEGTGKVVLQKHGQLIVELDPDLAFDVVPKGSIALDGVSLTVASKEGNRITVALIPHTLEHTTLGSLQKEDRVNVETDVMRRYSHAQRP